MSYAIFECSLIVKNVWCQIGWGKQLTEGLCPFDRGKVSSR